MSGLPQRRMRQAIMIAWPGRIMIRPAEPRMRGSDPRTAVYYANLSNNAQFGEFVQLKSLSVCARFTLAGTVKSHVAHILMKLGARDRVQAVIAAYEMGLVQPGIRSGQG